MSAATRGCIASYLRQFSICAFPTHHLKREKPWERGCTPSTCHRAQYIQKYNGRGEKKAEECRNTSIQDFGQFRRIVAGLLARAVHSEGGGVEGGRGNCTLEKTIFTIFIMSSLIILWIFGTFFVI